MIPKGVTIRKMSEPPRNNQTNLLWSAACCNELPRARGSLCEALWIPPNSQLAQIHLSDPVRWSKIGAASRLMEIAEWLKAECYEAMDLVESAAVSTKGD